MGRLTIKNTIWHKLLFFIALPFLGVLAVLLFSIIYSVYESKVGLANHLLENKTRFNAEHLKFTVDNVRLSLETVTKLLSRIDTTEPDARQQAERILQQSLLRNQNIYNIWLAYEPDAFDGRDASDRSGYPGAPNGRFIRSYINADGTILIVSDMNEESLDDPERSVWYGGAIRSKKPHININLDKVMLYDYLDGKGTQNVYSITLPLFRDGVVIGCVGADGRFDELFSGLDKKTKVVSMLFSESLRLIGTPDGENIGKSIDEIGLTDLTFIKQDLEDRKPVFFRNTRLEMVGGNAMISFEPVRLEPFGELTWIVTALPLSAIHESMYLVIAVIAGTMLFFSLLILFSLRYVARSVSRPIRAMIRTASDFSPEDLQSQLPQPKKNAGVVTLAFHRMLRTLHERIRKANWSQEMLDFLLFLEESLSPNVDLPDFFYHAAYRFTSVCQAKGATLRLYGAKGAADMVIHYDPVSEFRADDEDLRHWQTALREPLESADRTGMVWRYDVKDASGNTMTVCAFPLRMWEDEVAGGIFLSFDAPLLGGIERYAAFMAEEIAHRLAGQEMSLG
ncbi:MAG: hypothetical protein LBI31_07140 [Zoogloeaceae bacterium]|jgi:HAMP domain-containing protein|nr:hypothetical protein [Zoogloeaceae bacterium]